MTVRDKSLATGSPPDLAACLEYNDLGSRLLQDVGRHKTGETGANDNDMLAGESSRRGSSELVHERWTKWTTGEQRNDYRGEETR